ncbi:MAG: hypothetical protein AB7Y46_10770 [Armatimonadota bacterium]
MSWQRLLCWAGTMALVMARAPSAPAWEPQVTGYSQFRYTWNEDEEDGDFEARRIRLSWKDTLNDEGTTARIQLDLAGLIEEEDNEVELKDAWVSHPVSEAWQDWLGFGSVRFGYEVELSSSKRLPLERARVTRDFFPGERALGAAVRHTSNNGSGPVIDVMFTNGMDKWHDDDDEAQSFVARVIAPLGGSEAGVSYMTSRREGESYDVEPDVWGVHVRHDGTCGATSWAFQGEYMEGEFVSAGRYYDAHGWYALAEFPPAQSDATLFYRYDERERTAISMPGEQNGGSDSYRRNTFGVAWDLLENSRLTVQVEDIEGTSADDTTVGVQWQVIYK